jgi:hypothetical protein
MHVNMRQIYTGSQSYKGSFREMCMGAVFTRSEFDTIFAMIFLLKPPAVHLAKRLEPQFEKHCVPSGNF